MNIKLLLALLLVPLTIFAQTEAVLKDPATNEVTEPFSASNITLTSSTLSNPVLTGTWPTIIRSGTIFGQRIFPGPSFSDPERTQLGNTVDTESLAWGKGSLVIGGHRSSAYAGGSVIIGGYQGDDDLNLTETHGWHAIAVGRSIRVGTEHAGTYSSYTGSNKTLVVSGTHAHALLRSFALEVGQEIRLVDRERTIIGMIESIDGNTVVLTDQDVGSIRVADLDQNSSGGHWEAVADLMGDDSISLGYSLSSQANNVVNIGIYNVARGPNSVTLGTTATTGTGGNGAIAMGYSSSANAQYAVALGSGAVVTENAGEAEQIGTGTNDVLLTTQIRSGLRVNENNSVEVLTNLKFVAQSLDPDDPGSGHFVIWQSNGDGFGDAGDIIIKVQQGATTKTVTLVDFSAVTDEEP